MQITWYGQSCFKIVSGQSSIIIDPFNKSIGLTPPRGKSDILLVSDNTIVESDYSQIDANFVISGAGEYEVGGVYVNGMSAFNLDENGNVINRSIMYVITIEGMRICHLSNFSDEQVTELLDKIGQVDILMIPVGGDYVVNGNKISSLDSEKAIKVTSEIDPRVVIPMNFKIPKLSLDLGSVDGFMKASGSTDISPVEKYTIKKKDLPNDGREVVLMNLV